jgi:hypothetical protein
VDCTSAMMYESSHVGVSVQENTSSESIGSADISVVAGDGADVGIGIEGKQLDDSLLRLT